MDINSVLTVVETLSPEDRKVLGTLDQERPASPERLAADLYVLPTFVYDALSNLQRVNFVTETAVSKQKSLNGYVLTELGQIAKGLALMKEARGIRITSSFKPESMPEYKK